MLNTQELTKIWDKSHQNIPTDKDYSHYAEQVEAEFPPNSFVADLGGGTGADAIYFAKKGHSVTLYDISPAALERAKNKANDLGLTLAYVVVDFGDDNFEFVSGSYNIVYSRLALHYFTAASLTRIFSQIYQSLHVDGKAWITVKSPADVKEMEFLKSTSTEIQPGVFEENGQLKTRLTIEQLNTVLKEAGLPDNSYLVTEFTEDLGGRVDVTKSGNKVMTLNEVTIFKQDAG